MEWAISIVVSDKKARYFLDVNNHSTIKMMFIKTAKGVVSENKDKLEIDKLEQRLKKATSWWYFFSKFMDITLGRIKYTNDDIDELIEYYEKKIGVLKNIILIN
jgi:hypothetical protein